MLARPFAFFNVFLLGLQHSPAPPPVKAAPWFFLKDRPQRVCISSSFSDCLILNTGAPQRCVFLCIYTNKGQCNSPDLSLIKYADDMALVSCQQNLNSTSYCQYMNSLTSCFDHTFLDLSVVKTREMCFGGSRRDGDMDQTFKPISFRGCRWNRSPTSNILEHILTIHSLIRTKLTRQWLTLLRKLRKDLIPAIALWCVSLQAGWHVANCFQ